MGADVINGDTASGRDAAPPVIRRAVVGRLLDACAAATCSPNHSIRSVTRDMEEYEYHDDDPPGSSCTGKVQCAGCHGHRCE